MVKKQNKLNLRKKADRIFSVWIRLNGRGSDGSVQCYTCSHRGEYKKMQAGHFVPRQYLITRYDEVNVKPQCYSCNMLYNGQPSAYAKRLERDYGPGTVEMLESKRKIICPDFDYQFVIDEYTRKCKSLGFEV